MSHVFISYSHTDRDYAHRLAGSLQDHGFQVWIDDRIDYGMQWPRVIQDNLDACAAFVVIMTPRSYASDWVQSELNRAKRKQKPLFPILLEGDDAWLSVETTQFITIKYGELPPPHFYERLECFVPHGEAIATTPVAEFTLPLLEWCDVPAGTATIEGKSYDVTPFKISKYPVTNEQFTAFVDSSDGRANTAWWQYSNTARQERDVHNEPEQSTFIGNERPRETVSWYDAIAFTRWLSYKTRLAIMLPTEQQWQRAAQGDNKRDYPWGSTFDKTRCNTWESQINETTPVTRYANGAGEFGAFDMAGNVWEWCLNDIAKPAVPDLSSSVNRSLRGGSWGAPRAEARTVYRYHASPNLISRMIGFRLACVAAKP